LALLAGFVEIFKVRKYGTGLGVDREVGIQGEIRAVLASALNVTFKVIVRQKRQGRTSGIRN
jgi:hypothetical protein